METIELTGYTNPEKIKIFKNHVLPKLLKETGLDKYNVKIEFSNEIL